MEKQYTVCKLCKQYYPRERVSYTIPVALIKGQAGGVPAYVQLYKKFNSYLLFSGIEPQSLNIHVVKSENSHQPMVARYY